MDSAFTKLLIEIKFSNNINRIGIKNMEFCFFTKGSHDFLTVKIYIKHISSITFQDIN